MKICAELTETLLAEYQEKTKGQRLPKISSITCREDKGEGYELRYSAGNLKIFANSSLASVFALSLLNVAVPSEHWNEYLGSYEPALQLRILWFNEPLEDEIKCRILCRRALRLGFNTLLIENPKFIPIPKEYGLKVIIKWDGVTNIQGADYLFWETAIRSSEEELTLLETLLKELKKLEAIIPKQVSLIFKIPYYETLTPQQNAYLLNVFYLEVNSQTYVAFSSVGGDIFSDHLPQHPFFDLLRCSPSLQGNRLLPVFNAGGVGQGEGLWPSFSTDIAERANSIHQRHSFQGVICLVRSLPAEGGFLDGSLWIFNMALTHKIHPKLLLKTWLKAFKPESSSDSHINLFDRIRYMILMLSGLKNDSSNDLGKMMCEKIILDTKFFEAMSSEIEKKSTSRNDRVPMSDYMTFFIRDVKRILKEIFPNINIDDEMQESIWTQVALEGGNRKMKRLDRPNQGQSNKLKLIYKENHIN